MQKLSGINVLTNYISLGAPVKSTYLAVAWLDLKIAHTQNMLSHIAYIYTMLNLVLTMHSKFKFLLQLL